MLFSFPLKKNEDFKRVYRSRNSKADRYFIVYVFENGTCHNRLGVSVSKKVGNSVIRHRIKRLVKESYRLTEHNISSGFDIVVVARQGSDVATFYVVASSLSKLFKRHGIFTG